jgi:hypothetical protein
MTPNDLVSYLYAHSRVSIFFQYINRLSVTARVQDWKPYRHDEDTTYARLTRLMLHRSTTLNHSQTRDMGFFHTYTTLTEPKYGHQPSDLVETRIHHILCYVWNYPSYLDQTVAFKSSSDEDVYSSTISHGPRSQKLIKTMNHYHNIHLQPPLGVS